MARISVTDVNVHDHKRPPCVAQTTASLRLSVGTIPPDGSAGVTLPVNVSQCSSNSQFDLQVVFAANNGADVGTIINGAVSE
jgi:hypothetical protein